MKKNLFKPEEKKFEEKFSGKMQIKVGAKCEKKKLNPQSLIFQPAKICQPGLSFFSEIFPDVSELTTIFINKLIMFSTCLKCKSLAFFKNSR